MSAHAERRDLSPEGQARRRAHLDMRETFRLLGVDIDDQLQINQMRADLIYARKLRRLSEKTVWLAWTVIVGVVITAACAALWQGVRHAVGNTGP